MTERLAVCLMGASTDTGNLGVSALCLSILAGIARREPGADVVVFDNGRGPGVAAERFDGRTFRFRTHGLNDSRRIYRSDSLWNVRVASRLGGAGNEAALALRRADAVLDVTGGDSFTSLYGMRRFRSGCVAKRLALEYSGGLVLMPQTYGPYGSAAARAEAARLVSGAAAAWARDEASHTVLRDLLGRSFDAARHRRGVDVAFRLPASPPPEPLPPELEAWLGGGREDPTIGVNVSGLTYVHAQRARREYGLSTDYRAAIHGILDRFLSRTRARIVLVPHVHAPPGHFESDRQAALDATSALGAPARGRVLVAPDLGASQAKWLISRTDWFCGTRMHSTIAALSSGVPVAALAYSAKTRGVFETCGAGADVADLRALTVSDAVDAVWRAWESREDARARLAAALPHVLAQADSQMDEIVAVCRRLAAQRRDTPALGRG
jgi:polysaccharide pyruvyl transferase WcaK-like protein